MVENNAAQDHLVQILAADTTVPVRGFTTGRAKAHPVFGLESIAAELENGKWIFPCDEAGRCHPEVEALINEMLFYTPSGHTGDRLMGLYFAREVARELEGWAAMEAQNFSVSAR